MSSTVTTRPTHYEVLGLAPTASRAEVTRAFTREMSMLRPRPFGGLAELTIAHGVLSDPAKRRAFDREIGLTPEPEAKPAPAWHTHGAGSASFARAALPLTAAERPAIALAPQAEPERRRDPAPRRTRPIGEALAELARPEPLVARPVVAGPSTSEPLFAGPPPRAELKEDRDGATERAVPWKPLAIAGGGLVAVAALIGAWAGWQNQGGVPEKARVSALLTPPDTDFTVSDPSAAAAPGSTEVEPAPTVTPSPAPPHRGEGRKIAARIRPGPQLAEIEQQLAEPAPVEATPTPAAVPAEAEAAPVGATPASLPLSNATIARTIGRIGYPCGAVASTTPILGKAFTVTCTSGHSYRAAPVGGRYHFRKLR
jgi:hypothetical protein